MEIKHLRIRTVIISYLVFFAGYELTTIAVTSISVYALGLIFGWVFRKNRSIWTAAILHSAWDLITWVL